MMVDLLVDCSASLKDLKKAVQMDYSAPMTVVM